VTLICLSFMRQVQEVYLYSAPSSCLRVLSALLQRESCLAYQIPEIGAGCVSTVILIKLPQRRAGVFLRINGLNFWDFPGKQEFKKSWQRTGFVQIILLDERNPTKVSEPIRKVLLF